MAHVRSIASLHAATRPRGRGRLRGQAPCHAAGRAWARAAATVGPRTSRLAAPCPSSAASSAPAMVRSDSTGVTPSLGPAKICRISCPSMPAVTTCPTLRLRSSRSAGHKRGARERVPDARRVRLVYVHPRHPRSRPGVNTQPSIQACKLIRGSAEPDRLASSVRAACRPRAGTGRPNRLLISRWPGQIGDRLREYCSDAEGYESRLSAAEAERRVPGAVRVDPIGRVPPGAAMPWRRRSPAAGPTTRLRSPRESRARRDVDLSDEFSGEDGRPDPDQADEPESLDHLVSTG